MEFEVNEPAYIDKDYKNLNDITIYTKTVTFYNGRLWQFDTKV